MTILTFLCLTSLGVALAALWIVINSTQKLVGDVTNFVNTRTQAMSAEVAVVARNLSVLHHRIEELEAETAVELRRQRKLSIRLENELARAKARTANISPLPSRPRHAR